MRIRVCFPSIMAPREVNVREETTRSSSLWLGQGRLRYPETDPSRDGRANSWPPSAAMSAAHPFP